MNKKKTFKAVVPVIIVIAAVFVMKLLVSGRTSPVREVKEARGVLVDVLTAVREDIPAIVKGTGIVQAARGISVIPQVSGSVVYTAPELVAGGFFSKDEVMLSIDETDYRLSVDLAMSAKAKAEYELASMENRAGVARTEWELINNDKEAEPDPLVVYTPQLRNARAALKSASAQVEQALINLERTKIRAPFNARVRNKDADVGQYVRAGSVVAEIAGTDTAEIAVPLTLKELEWLDVPGYGMSRKGGPARVVLSVDGRQYEWEGRVVRSTGEVDPKSRMVKVVVEVEDPYGTEAAKAGSAPVLAMGAFVDVYIEGRTMKDVFAVPRTALRDGSTVWIMGKDNKLRIRAVETLRTEREKVFISGGLSNNERVVLTNISGAADGMKLRTAGHSGSAEAEQTGK